MEIYERRWLIAVDMTPHKTNGDRLVKTDVHRWYATHTDAWELVEVVPVSLLREAWRYSDPDAPGWTDMDRRVKALVAFSDHSGGQ